MVPKSDNVETKRIKTAYSTAAATTYIQFDNVKVPVNHLLGKEDQGFIVIMSNFNHERYAPPKTLACSKTNCEQLHDGRNGISLEPYGN